MIVVVKVCKYFQYLCIIILLDTFLPLNVKMIVIADAFKIKKMSYDFFYYGNCLYAEKYQILFNISFIIITFKPLHLRFYWGICNNICSLRVFITKENNISVIYAYLIYKGKSLLTVLLRVMNCGSFE